jgi:PPOX class probable F420-dependent enzyme
MSDDTVLTAADLALIDEPHLGFVATVMADGSPQITPVWVDSDGENLRFNTARGRVKTNNLERDSSVAVLVIDEQDPYRWVSIRGTAELIDDGADEHIDGLATKYTGADRFGGRTPGQQRVTVKVVSTHRPVRFH